MTVTFTGKTKSNNDFVPDSPKLFTDDDLRLSFYEKWTGTWKRGPMIIFSAFIWHFHSKPVSELPVSYLDI